MLQSKLLRVLEDQEVRPVGGIQSTKVDLRFIMATNKNLQKAVRTRTFREDLFYRINTINISLFPSGSGRRTYRSSPGIFWHGLERSLESRSKPSPTTPSPCYLTTVGPAISGSLEI